MTNEYDTEFLDEEEKTLINSIENGDGWITVPHFDEWKKLMMETAENTIEQNQLLYLHLPRQDLDGIKLKSIEQGVSYQSLVTSIIHKYLSGKLVEGKR
jgi:predicted DNA binding CopG/RHH family protein